MPTQALLNSFTSGVVDSFIHSFIHSYNKIVTECLVTPGTIGGNMVVNEIATVSVLVEPTYDGETNKTSSVPEKRDVYTLLKSD